MMSAQTIPAAIKAVAQNVPDHIALQIPQNNGFRSHTYRELVTQMEQGADQLRKAELRPGDRIILLAENMPEWAIACLGALEMGATVVPLDPALTLEEIKTLIGRADVRGIMLSESQFEILSSNLPNGLPIFNIEDCLTPFGEDRKSVV